MKYNPKMVESMGNLVCASIADVLIERKMPQVLLGMSEGAVKQVRMVLLDNRQIKMEKNEIQNRVAALKATPGKDIGFSYTDGHVRVIVVPEEMSIFPVLGAPLGTPRG